MVDIKYKKRRNNYSKSNADLRFNWNIGDTGPSKLGIVFCVYGSANSEHGLEALPNDESQSNNNSMTLSEATEIAKKRGDGWRIPTKEELTLLHKEHERVGNFSNTFYWSSTKGGSTGAWCLGFKDGEWGFHSKFYKHYVRLIREF